MDLLLVPIIGLLAIYVVYREWLSIAYRQWQSELDLFKKRLAAYQQLRSVVERTHASHSVSTVDTDRFAQAMSDMRFLFDDDLERFVSSIYDALLKKHALDALIEKAADQESPPADQDLIEQARSKSRELTARISDGIYREMPERMERFMRPQPVSSASTSSSA